MRNERIEWIGWLLFVVFSANALNAPGAGIFPATSFEYDEAGRQVKVIDALLQETTFTYDQAGRRTAVTDALSRVTSSEYDEAGRLTKTTFPDTTTATNTYDNATGRLLSRTDQMGYPTNFEYDALGRLTAVIDALNQRTEYEYDEVGAQTVQRDAKGRETTYAYDQLGRRVGRTLPDGQSESMSYDVIGNLATRTDFNGHTTTYTYDLMNRLTQKQADAGHPSLAYNHAPKTITYGYDDLGRRTTAESQNSGGQVLYQDAWTYDSRGRTINHASSNGAITYDYDATGNLTLTQSNHPQGGATTTYDYDGLNRLINVYDHNVDDGAGNVPAAAHYAYDGVGNLSTMSYSNGVQHAYTYNTLNRLTQLTVTDALSNVLHSYNHTLNAAGHKTQVVEADGRTVNYAFDQLHRLQSETIAASPGPMGVNGTASYAYDQVSNRISRTSSIAGVVNQSLAFNNNDQIDGSGYAYDDNGSTTQGPDGSADVYSFDNMLIRRVNTGQGLTVDMVYSATGDRVQKVTNGVAVNYLVDANNHTGYAQVLEETDAAGNLEAVMVYGHDLISQDRADGQGGFEMSFYSYDGLGSVRGLTDSVGTSLGQYHYDAYGTKIEDTVSVANPYLFAGERFDNDLGLYYLRARYLDTETGRFWSLDDFEGNKQEALSLHKYLYAHANPVSNVDPSGNSITLTDISISIREALGYLPIIFPKTFIGIRIFIGVLTSLAILSDPRQAYSDFQESVAMFGPIGVANGLRMTTTNRMKSLSSRLPFFKGGAGKAKRLKEFLRAAPSLKRGLNGKPGRAVGLGEMKAGGKELRLPAVSGRGGHIEGAPLPTNPRFTPTANKPGYNPADKDVEFKILESFAEYLDNANISPDSVTIFVDKPVCNSCRGVIAQFENRYSIIVEVISP